MSSPLLWGSNKFGRDFSLFCLVFWAFRFPLKIVFQGYDHQSHSYTQFACLHMYIFIGRPSLLPGLFQDQIFQYWYPDFCFEIVDFFLKIFCARKPQLTFPCPTLYHTSPNSLHTPPQQRFIKILLLITRPGTMLQCLLHCWTKKQKLWCLKFWTN